LGQISAPAPPPASIAGFRIAFPVQGGNSQRTPERGYQNRSLGSPQEGAAWPVSVEPTLGTRFRATSTVACIEPPAMERPAVDSHAFAVQMRMPRFELIAMGGISGVEEKPAPAAPPAPQGWMPLPEAQPAERFLASSFSVVQMILSSSRHSETLALANGKFNGLASTGWVASAAAQPAERFAAPSFSLGQFMLSSSRHAQRLAVAGDPITGLKSESWIRCRKHSRRSVSWPPPSLATSCHRRGATMVLR